MLKIFTDPRCLEHQSPPGYPELPDRLLSVVDRLREQAWDIESSIPQDTSAKRAEEAVLAVHDMCYVERLRAAVERGDGLIDSADNPLSSGTWTAALAAVECALRGCDWAVAEPGRTAFVAVRPPGHHAERDTAMGFCYFNTIAVAAEYLLRHHRLERVAILDVDVHHGNGTQHLFEDRAEVFFASLHQFPFYPGTGARSEIGRGAGEGATLNVPMTAGSGDDEYLRALDQDVLPALRRFAPDLLLISAGFDAWRGDPLGGMNVSVAGYKAWGQRLAALAAECCGGRTVSVFEGGYDVPQLGELATSFLTGLADLPGEDVS